ncbi:hypothetical protein Cni_G19110 [Canna indica]|uniref:Fe2OG dioxygenase domain-containing protein n=1 Tax=Canna indica TaxID=4628 RepID=A0AAQ3KLX3_9LILI|nr:hypothetical protein Cni_G19110 [Canna indica]
MALVPCSEVRVGDVQDIQELRRSRPMVVPERYVRDVNERPALSTTVLPSVRVPIIDLSKLVCGSRWETQEEMAKLAAACEEWGFFQVINHGIDEELLEKMEKLAKEFFMLPLEEKEKYPMPPGTIQGYGHAFVFSEEQKLDWCNMLALAVEPAFNRKPHLWPTNPAALSETLEKYSASIRRLCQILLILIARNLGLSSNYFNEMFGEAVQAVRMNYYPPCARPDLVLGLSPHSDGSALTVLQQDTGSIGLQILKDSAWVPVHPIPNALVINIGDTIEVWAFDRTYQFWGHLVVRVGDVQDIQELRRSRPMVVPERYVRDVNERPALSTVLPSLPVPVIDLSKLDCSSRLETQEEMAKLVSACEEWGFFQVINHGIDEELLEKMEKLAKEFFMLPLEEKEKYPMPPGAIQGYGHAFVFSEDQKLDWCNMLALALEPAFIRKPHLWPTNPPALSETLEKYSASIRRLCQIMLILIARNLGLSPNYFNEMFGEVVQAVRMNYYPPCARPDLVLGLSPHSDGSALTVLQQDTGSIGLQILKDSSWVPVHPIPNALVINIGDTIEFECSDGNTQVLTNGKYKSVEHRAVTNEETYRLSLVTFYAPSYDVELGPIPELVNDKQPCRYRRYNHGEYSHHYITNKLQGKKTLEFAKINTLT